MRRLSGLIRVENESGESPISLLCDQRLSIVAARLKRGLKSDGSPTLAQCDTNVPQKTAPFDRLSAISKKHAELLIAQTDIIAQRYAHCEDAQRPRLIARYLGKTIPWGSIKAIVAPNSISDKWSKIQRDGT